MRRVNSVLWSTTMLTAMFAAASPALAQTEQPAPVDPNVQAQQSPAQPAGSAQTGNAAQATNAQQQAASDAGSIVVTGLRRSLQSARNIKRNSPQVIDAIVAEDIGKLPDVYVSDTAARIPGVQVERGGGEAGRVLVRGLPDFTTTYNGREIFTAETRQVALQDFPAGAIGAIEVFKTSTANLVEPGLAGLVNVRSQRPFDFKGLQIAGSVWGIYPLVSRDFAPNGQLLLSDRWKVGDGEMGALINVSYSQLHYRDSTRSNTDFVALNGDGQRLPDIQRVTYGEGRRSRPSVNGALQWRPNPDLEFYVEGLYQGFRNELQDRELTVPLWGGAPFTNVQFRDGTNLIESATVANPFRPDGFQGGTLNRTRTYQLAVGGRWDHGPLRLTADIAHTSSRFKGLTESVDYQFASRQTIDFVTNTPGSSGPTFTILNFDPTNPANYQYRGFYEENQVAKGKDIQARLDAEYRTDLAFLPKIEVGTRYVDRTADRQFGSRYSTLHGGQAIHTVPLDYELFDRGFRGDDNAPFPIQWFAPTYQSIRANVDELRAFAGYPAGPPPFNPTQKTSATEKSWAVYGQLDYKFGIVNGQIGVRGVHTSDDVSGNQLFFESDPDGPGPLPPVTTIRPVQIQQKYWDWLPNANAQINFTDQLKLRLSATKTRTRPNFRDITPSYTIDQPGSCFSQTPLPAGCILTGTGGNPNLKRLKSNNYDASLEYYFSRTGFAALAVFRRDLKGFIEPSASEFTEPTTGLPLRLNTTINSGAGRIDGFEAQVQTFFDWAWVPEFARRFGAQANVTYLDAKADFTYNEPMGPGGTLVANTVNRRLLGVSKWSYNLVGMYEGGGITARLAYNWRSPWWSVYQRRDTGSAGSLNIYEERVRGVSRLDWSSSYDVNKHATIFFDWTNILKSPFRSELYRTQVATGDRVAFPRAVRNEESVLSGGVRFRF